MLIHDAESTAKNGLSLVGSILTLVDFDYVSAGVTLLVGLVSGATGGVLAAREIGMRTREGERRYEAVTVVRGTLTTYRDVLDFRRNRLYENHGFPPEYGEVRSQEELASGILRELPYLRKRTRDSLRADLTSLVGSATIALAEARLHVPPGEIDPEREGDRQESVLRHILKEPGYIDRHGLLGLLLTTQNDADQVEHHRRAISVLDHMIMTLKP